MFTMFPQHPLIDALRAIERRDPDGWEFNVPTDADRTAFRTWAIDTFGHDAWLTYRRDPWGSWGTDAV